MNSKFNMALCLRCRGILEQSGREPYRFICPECKQHYFLIMQLVPVESESVKSESEYLLPNAE
jgi:Zn finger protein HypA/HybF involved in hydrogenase expression